MLIVNSKLHLAEGLNCWSSMEGTIYWTILGVYESKV